jgi:hypothetical protein
LEFSLTFVFFEFFNKALTQYIFVQSSDFPADIRF